MYLQRYYFGIITDPHPFLTMKTQTRPLLHTLPANQYITPSDMRGIHECLQLFIIFINKNDILYIISVLLSIYIAFVPIK